MMRILFGIAFLVILGMIYWSSLLVEKNLKEIKSEIEELKRGHVIEEKASECSSSEKKARPHIDATLPNLLEEDAFYSTTLPQLLGENFKPKGIRREAIVGKPEHLHPFNGFRDVASMWGLCSVNVASSQFGKYEMYAPNAAIKVEARKRSDIPGVSEFWVHLREGMYWQPLNPLHFPSGLTLDPHFLKKHPVTAYDFKFYFDAVMNPFISEAKASALRNYLGDIEEFIVIDSLTFVVRWRAQEVEDSFLKIKYSALNNTMGLQPLPCFVYQYFSNGQKIIDETDPDAYRKNSIWAQNFSTHFAKNIIVSCGAWDFDGMDDEKIKFRRNPTFFKKYAALTEGIHYTFKQSAEALWQDFKGEKLDLCQLVPSQLPELENFLQSKTYEAQEKRNLAIKEISFVEPAFHYIGWNEKTQFFNQKRVRQAMTMAIDRTRIISQNLNEMGVAITGPFFLYSPSYDKSIEPWPYNPEEAKNILREEGWVDLDGDGIRDKIVGGKRVPFRFTLTYYAKNLMSKIICEYVSTALKEIGVACLINGVDITDLSHTFEDKSFDAIYFGWSLGSPPEDPRQLWHSRGANEKGSSNAIGFSNPVIDELIEKLQYEYDPQKRTSLYHRFHKIIHEEEPYTFLYSPKRRLLYREYVQNVFIPSLRQDLVPGAEVSEPDLRVIWLK